MDLAPIGDDSPMTETESAGELPPMLNMDNFEAAKPRVTPDIAAARSRSYELSFGGKGGGPVALEPFSKTRQVGSQCIGVEIFNNPMLWDELAEKKSYNGILRDAIFVVYLCVSPVSVSKKAARIPARIADEALDWWERHGGGIGSREHGDLMEVFSNIVEDVFSVMAETATEGGGGDSGLGE